MKLKLKRAAGYLLRKVGTMHAGNQTRRARRDSRCREGREYCLMNMVKGERKESAVKWDILLTSKGPVASIC